MKLDKYTVGKRYSKALFELAMEQNQLEEVEQQLLELKAIFDEEPELGFILTDVRLSLAEKEVIVKKLEQGFSGIVRHFIRVVYEYRRMDDLPLMIADFEKLCDQHRGIIHGTVTTVIPLNERQQQALSEQLARLLDCKEVILTNKVDDSIIGGMVVEADNRIIDGSIKEKLNKLSALLLN